MSVDISALFDGEFEEDQLPDLLDELYKNPDLQKEWQEYQLIQTAIRGECTRADLLAVYAGEEQLNKQRHESTSGAAQPHSYWKQWSEKLRRRWGGWVGGVGLAAGLSAAAVIGFVSSSIFDFQISKPQAPYAVGSQLGDSPNIWVSTTNLTSTVDSSANHLNQALVAHNNYTGINELTNYARLVSYEQ